MPRALTSGGSVVASVIFGTLNGNSDLVVGRSRHEQRFAQGAGTAIVAAGDIERRVFAAWPGFTWRDSYQ